MLHHWNAANLIETNDELEMEIDTNRGDGGFEFHGELEIEVLPVAAIMTVGDGGSLHAFTVSRQRGEKMGSGLHDFRAGKVM